MDCCTAAASLSLLACKQYLHTLQYSTEQRRQTRIRHKHYLTAQQYAMALRITGATRPWGQDVSQRHHLHVCELACTEPKIGHEIRRTAPSMGRGDTQCYTTIGTSRLLADSWDAGTQGRQKADHDTAWQQMPAPYACINITCSSHCISSRWCRLEIR